MFKNIPLSWFEPCSDLFNVDSSLGMDYAARPLQISDTQPHANVSWQQVRDQFNRASGSEEHTEHQAFVDLWTRYVLAKRDSNPS